MLRTMVGFARVIHVISAVWVLLLGFGIIADVMGRSLFSYPIRGTTEIIKASVVAITFLQLPLAIFSGSMLRTEIFADALPPVWRKLLRTVGYILGAILFLLIVYSAWDETVASFLKGEYEGEGALRVPTWPVRFMLIGTSVFSAFAYLSMIWMDWTGQLEMDIAYPGILSFDTEAAAVMTDGKGAK
ncbi:MAG: TRAP transporter small permease [Paracoccaceae bacterium]|nr:TRAP transporter small permease [Paracoccaceae bacterium]